jgi:hypothetical protein
MPTRHNPGRVASAHLVDKFYACPLPDGQRLNNTSGTIVLSPGLLLFAWSTHDGQRASCHRT